MPSIILGGTLYHSRFSMGAMYRLESMGLNITQWDDTVRAEVEAGRNVQLTCKIASACLGTMVRGKWTPAPFSAEELADMIDPAEAKSLRTLIVETMEKVRRAQAPAPAAAEAEQSQAA